MNLSVEVFTSLLAKLYFLTTSLILFYRPRLVVLFFVLLLPICQSIFISLQIAAYISIRFEQTVNYSPSLHNCC